MGSNQGNDHRNSRTEYWYFEEVKKSIVTASAKKLMRNAENQARTI